MASLIPSLKRDDSGSVAVEFALVAPVLVLILAGVVDIGSATYARLSLDARVTAAAEYAMLQPAPGDQDSADDLAARLAGLLQGEATDTGEVVVNNAAGASWTGTGVTASPRSGEATMCYCPTLEQGDIVWGPPAECATPCTDGGTAGQFVQLSATTRHVTIFPGYAFIDGDSVSTRTVLRLQ
ncbi:TadE/TadG family type IV pilus assembly protein [Nioella halotolerans]|uniref:TadE/TadG family type IV pilus assembly protein n=1 Tax=Nioella halotolerans TaxID=2303578 RepID=UPI003F65742B